MMVCACVRPKIEKKRRIGRISAFYFSSVAHYFKKQKGLGARKACIGFASGSSTQGRSYSLLLSSQETKVELLHFMGLLKQEEDVIFFFYGIAQ